MRNLYNNIIKLIIGMQCKIYDLKNDERGDTNFLSIIIILAIVIVMAGAFIALKDQIFAWINERWEGFKDSF